MAEIQNEFSWSWSRHQTFAACAYRYWLMYYGSWGGWKANAPAEVRRRYVEKKLSNRHQWAGIVVHEVAAKVLGALREGRRPEPERVVEHTRQRVERDLRLAAGTEHLRWPSRVLGLQEYYYRDQEGLDALPEVAARITRQVAGLFENAIFQRLSSVPERIVEVEHLHRTPIGGVSVWVSMDVLVRAEDGRYIVVDWKTGDHHASAAVNAQLGVYVADVLARFYERPAEQASDEDAAKVSTLAAYVADGSHHTTALSAADLRATIAAIQTSAAAMRARLTDVADNTASEGDFQRLPAGSVECLRCGLRGACGRS